MSVDSDNAATANPSNPSKTRVVKDSKSARSTKKERNYHHATLRDRTATGVRVLVRTHPLPSSSSAQARFVRPMLSSSRSVKHFFPPERVYWLMDNITVLMDDITDDTTCRDQNVDEKLFPIKLRGTSGRYSRGRSLVRCLGRGRQPH